MLRGRLSGKDENFYTGMYSYLSSFVHGDPISNRGAEDQPIWFTTTSIPLSCLTAELIDDEIFSSQSHELIQECLTSFDEDSHLLKNLEPLKPKK